MWRHLQAATDVKITYDGTSPLFHPSAGLQDSQVGPFGAKFKKFGPK